MRQKFSIFSRFFHQLYYILGDIWTILRHNSNPLSFHCRQSLYIPLHLSFSSFQRRIMENAGRKLNKKIKLKNHLATIKTHEAIIVQSTVSDCYQLHCNNQIIVIIKLTSHLFHAFEIP